MNRNQTIQFSSFHPLIIKCV